MKVYKFVYCDKNDNQLYVDFRHCINKKEATKEAEIIKANSLMADLHHIRTVVQAPLQHQPFTYW